MKYNYYMYWVPNTFAGKNKPKWMDPTTTKLFLSATSIDQLVVTRENGHVVQWQRLQV
jgi:hypothetical protein